jgi:hypothetical protein
MVKNRANTASLADGNINAAAAIGDCRADRTCMAVCTGLIKMLDGSIAAEA